MSQIKSLRKTRTIAVNDAHCMIPDADMLYAADHQWWRYHKFRQAFKGERWTQDKGPEGWREEARLQGLNVIGCRHQLMLSRDPLYVGSGWNSAFQALNIAVLQGATRILLLGVDLHERSGKHFFGEHPPPLQRNSPFKTMIRAFETAAAQLETMRVTVINCSPDSALKCFPVMRVSDAVR